MRLIKLKTTDSTSIQAKLLLEQGKKPPFAVLAEDQTTGHGRFSRKWESPPGNIYLSIATPKPKDPSDYYFLSLKAGVIIAKWIDQKFGIRITLKWPNDLQFGGRKLGGILCECSYQGEEAGHPIIGLGLNIMVSPKLSEGILKPISLAEIISLNDNPGNLAEDFLAFWEKEFDHLSNEKVMSIYREFMIPLGQLWQDESGIFYTNTAISPVGHLGLKNMINEDLELSSTSRDYYWIYQDLRRDYAKALPLIIADIGNTSVKVALFANRAARDPDFVESAVNSELGGSNFLSLVKARFLEAIPNFLNNDQTPKIPLYLASVNNQVLQTVSALARTLGFMPIQVSKRPVRCFFSKNKVYSFEDIGIDRLSAIEALLSDTKNTPTKYAIVVLCGTATTIDVLDLESREPKGGMIFPGLRTALSSLHEKTALLPLLEMDKISQENNLSHPSLGFDTQGAMISGTINMTIGAIKSAKEFLLSQCNISSEEIKIIASGGYGPHVAKLVQADFDQNLVLRGIKTMVLGG